MRETLKGSAYSPGSSEATTEAVVCGQAAAAFGRARGSSSFAKQRATLGGRHRRIHRYRGRSSRHGIAQMAKRKSSAMRNLATTWERSLDADERRIERFPSSARHS